MARITYSDQYFHKFDGCDLRDCERHYCNEHRLLWRDCDTAREDYDGAGQSLWELLGCPACEWESKERRYQEEREARERQQAAQKEWDKLKALADNHNEQLRKAGLSL